MALKLVLSFSRYLCLFYFFCIYIHCSKTACLTTDEYSQDLSLNNRLRWGDSYDFIFNCICCWIIWFCFTSGVRMKCVGVRLNQSLLVAIAVAVCNIIFASALVLVEVVVPCTPSFRFDMYF